MRRTARVIARRRAAYASTLASRVATQVPWKNVVETRRHPTFSATVIQGSCSTVASKSPRIRPANRSAGLVAPAQVVTASRGMAPSNICRPA